MISHRNNLAVTSLVVFGLFFFLVLAAWSWAVAEEPGVSKVIFYVA